MMFVTALRSLFAVLDMASDKVVGSLSARHRAIEFTKFLERTDTEVLPELASIWCWTTTGPTRRRPSAAGSSAILVSNSTSQVTAGRRGILRRRPEQRRGAGSLDTSCLQAGGNSCLLSRPMPHR